MVRYGSKIGGYNMGRRYESRDPYRILNPYKRRIIYKPLGYKGSIGTRRGYSSRRRSYTPSRRTQHYQRQSTLPYRPVPKQSAPSHLRIKEEPHYKMPRIEPDTEEMLKQLEKRFDKKLHEQVLERLEAEFEKLKETLYKERAEKEEIDEMIMRENEAFLEEHKDDLIEKLLIGDVDDPDRMIENSEVSDIKKETKAEVENKESADRREKLEAEGEIEVARDGQVETEKISANIETKEAEVETLNADELYEIDEDLEWLKDLDESPPEINEESDAMETEQTLQPIEALASQEAVEKPDLGKNKVEVATLENPVEIENEQLQDLEPILDQIEPIKPIEPRVEIAPEILPENVEEEPLEEGETY